MPMFHLFCCGILSYTVLCLTFVDEEPIINGFKHEVCSNGVLKEINKSNGENIPCIGSHCGQFEKRNNKIIECEKQKEEK